MKFQQAKNSTIININQHIDEPINELDEVWGYRADDTLIVVQIAQDGNIFVYFLYYDENDEILFTAIFHPKISSNELINIANKLDDYEFYKVLSFLEVPVGK